MGESFRKYCIKDNPNFVNVDLWQMDRQFPVTYDGNIFIVKFDELFKRDDIKEFGKFLILKSSYVSKLGLITQHINYFCRFYDAEGELIMAYLKLRFLIKDADKYTPLAFRNAVYKIMFTPTIVDKIKAMVEDNYCLDIDKDGEAKSKFSDDIRFMDIHTKILLRASTAVKMMIPPVVHFLYNTKENINEKVLLFRFFEPTLTLFTEEKIDVYNKLKNWIDKSVEKNVKGNQESWRDKDALSMENALQKARSLFQKDLMIDVLYKYVFIETRPLLRDGNPVLENGEPVILKKIQNPVILNNIVIRQQLEFSNRNPRDFSLNEISSKPPAEQGEMTKLDTILLNQQKIDESQIIISDANINTVITMLRNKMNYVTDEEIRFYFDNVKISKIQKTLVDYYFAKSFGGFTDLNGMNRWNYITCMVIMKRRLQAEGFVYLPQLITAKIDGKISNRSIHNTKFLNELQSDPLFQVVVDEKFSVILDTQGSDNVLISLISAMINSKFTFVDYQMADKMDEIIEVDSSMLKREYIDYLNMI